MENSESLTRAIAVTHDLHSVVKNMKALAAVNIRQCERAAHAVAEYNHTIEMGLQIALRNVPPHLIPPKYAAGQKMGAVVFGSDQGMCGTLNDHVVSHALRAMGKLGVHRTVQSTLAVGARVAAQMESRGRELEGSISVPSSTAGISRAVDELLAKIEEWHFTRGIEFIVLFYAGPASRASYRVRAVRLLPVDAEWINSLRAKPWPSKVIPTFTLDEIKLYRLLLREYLFVTLFRAFAESLASENASRLVSMQVAEKNIEERLRVLTAESRHVRQSSIASELLDIIASFEALDGKER